VKTLYGVWVRRPTRKGQRDKTWAWGWVQRVTHLETLWTKQHSPRAEDGFMLYEEAEEYALLIAAKFPELIGWFEIRLFAVLTTPVVGISPGTFLAKVNG
jgi:hypothetical protein